jgi:GNAT superfamily N-acetyltransferase
MTLKLATADSAEAIAELLTSAALTLTVQYGKGHWSNASTARGVLHTMRTSRVYVAEEDGRAVATLTLTTKKPWAIDTSYFAARPRPLYLMSMAVAPAQQGRGIGRECVEQAKALCRAWPADAIRLDAYDATAGAGAFYRKCGFREVGRVIYRKVPLIYFEWIAARTTAGE